MNTSYLDCPFCEQPAFESNPDGLFWDDWTCECSCGARLGIEVDDDRACVLVLGDPPVDSSTSAPA